MNPNQAAQLLAIVAAYDNRKPDTSTAQAWAMALDGLRLEDCREVVIQHYRGSTEWIMPAHVIAGVKRLRAKRLDGHEPIDPPAGMDADDVPGYLRWVGAHRQAIADGEPPPAPPELPKRTMPDLHQLMPKVDKVTALEKAREDRVEHRRRLEAARAEMRAIPIPGDVDMTDPPAEEPA